MGASIGRLRDSIFSMLRTLLVAQKVQPFSADSAKRRSDISHVHVGHTKTKWSLLLAALYLAVKATPTTTNQ
jgi:hypothetical protein